jgi:hypothetical protein
MKKIALVSLVTLFAVSNSLLGQEHHQENETHQSENHNEFKRHRLAVEFGYTHIPDGYEEEEGDQSVWVPSFGIEYLYRFSHKWGAALTVNMETGNYLIEFQKEDLERENVLIIAAVAVYEVVPRWAVFAGPGIEIEKHHHFGLIRLGTDYEIPLKNNWDITPTFTLDHKIDYYSYEFVIAIGKKF